MQGRSVIIMMYRDEAVLFTLSVFSLFSVCLVPPCLADLTGGLAAYERHEYQTAIKEFQALADQGDPFAQFMLGYMYAHGEGLAQDYAEAARSFLQAASKGNIAAQFNLGVLYDEGHG